MIRKPRYMSILAALLLLPAVAVGADPHPLIDSPALEHPAFGMEPAQKVFDERLLPLWLKVLERNDPELRRLAAGAIGDAHEQGMPGTDAAVAPLLATLNATDQDVKVSIAAAEALIKLDAEQAAPLLLKLNETHGGAVAQLLDPALAKWDYKPARELWNSRIADSAAPAVLRGSAMTSAAAVGDATALSAMRELAQPGRPAALRLAAARAIGTLATSGVEAQARAMARSQAVIDRIVAAEMLESSTASGARRLLRDLAGDASPTVAGAAVQSLKPEELAAEAETLAGRDDTTLRGSAVVILTARADRKAVDTLAGMLSDINPDVRNAARAALQELAGQSSLDAAVRSAVTRQLDASAWQAREQAALLVGQLDHEPAGAKLLDLMRDERHEVRMAAIAALRWLEDDAHNAAILKHLEALMAGGAADDPRDVRMQRLAEIEQLVQTLGLMRYAEAEAALRKFVPKKAPFSSTGRVGAIWALGRILEGQQTSDLAGQFAGRLRDWEGMEPEGGDVRQMAAIGIGMLKANGQVGTLRSFYDGEMLEVPIARACRWSLLQVDPSLDLAEVEQSPSTVGGWFIEPLKE